jgi:hypothetical protein
LIQDRVENDGRVGELLAITFFKLLALSGSMSTLMREQLVAPAEHHRSLLRAAVGNSI